MNKIEAVIIEDELPAARLLNKMISEIRPEWNITILPGNIEESTEWFEKNPHPDIIFLDIQLNDGISFIFIEQAKPKSFIIFTTAYDEYAVRAFTVNSIDYLLKPIHKERLNDAIEKFEKYHNLISDNQKYDIEELIKNFSNTNKVQYRTRFLVNSLHKFYIVQVDDIAYFFSEDKVTFAVTKDGKKHIINFPLSRLEEQLDNKRFMRVNRQFILSAECIKNMENYFYGKMIINVFPNSNEKIIISREKIHQIKMWMSESL